MRAARPVRACGRAEKDRTRSAMATVFGGPRTGRGQVGGAARGNRGSDGPAEDQAFLVSQKILSIWAM